MKDYRLSEIVTHCKEMHNSYGEKACDNCDGARFCENQFANIPQYWTDEYGIEPRDMVELPCVEHRITDYGEDMWDVYYRNVIGGVIDYSRFNTEAKANAFLARLRLKGGTL